MATRNILCNLLILSGLFFGFSIGSEETIKCGELKYNNAVKTLMLRNGFKSGVWNGFVWVLSIIKQQENQIDVIDYEEEGNNNNCKGLLIHPRVVVTTAHCVEKYSPENLEVRTGGWIPEELIPLISQQNPSIISQQIRYVSNISLHTNYNSCKMHKNHALLLLSESFDVNQPEVGVICLSNSKDFSLQCQDFFSTESFNNISCKNYFHYTERFRMCPLNWDDLDQFYYSGIFRFTRIWSRKSKKSKNAYDSFTGNRGWIRSFLHENNVNNTDYKI